MAKIVYLYQHVAKCGGRSFISACSQWFPVYHEKLGSYPDKERVAEFARTRPDLKEWPGDLFLHGHLIYDGIRPHERYGDLIANGTCRLMTIVRDPLERHVSAFFHRRKRGRGGDETLDEWLSRGKDRMTHSLGLPGDQWRERLDEYFLVGTTELLALATDLLALRTGNPRLETPVLNATPRDGEQPGEAAVARFRERNERDYAVFAYATERLRREAAEMGLPVPAPAP